MYTTRPFGSTRLISVATRPSRLPPDGVRRRGPSLPTASGVPASASANPSERASTTAPASPFGNESPDTAIAVRMRSLPDRRITGSGGGGPPPPPPLGGG